MLGVLVNFAAVLIFGTLGFFIKGAEKYEKPITNVLGMAVLFFGISGCVKGLTHENSNTLLFVCSLVIGTIIGELLKIDTNFQNLGNFLGRKFGNSGTFAQGFVKASFIFCVGALAVIGPLESGLTGDNSILFAKSVIDGVMAVILTSTMGIGVVFSAFTILFYEGFFATLAGYIAPIVTPDSIRELSTVGNVLIAAIGFDVLGIAKINFANMLPAVFLPLIFYLPFVQGVIQSILNIF